MKSAVPARLQRIEARTVVDSIVVRDVHGARIDRLVPGDTTLVDAYLSDADGFGDVSRVDLVVARGQPSAVNAGPTEGASFRWKRTDLPPWSRTSSPDSWQIPPAMCWAETSTTAVDSRLVRFAFVVSPIARASSTGEWLVEVDSQSADDEEVDGLDMAEKLSLVGWDPAGRFESGPAGALSRSLVEPVSGEAHVVVISNAPWRISGRARRFVGQSDGAQGFDILASQSRLRWESEASGTVTGVLDSSMTMLMGDLPASITESATHQPIRLELDHPAGLGEQTYGSTLDLGLALVSGADSVAVSIPLTATVMVGGLPADSALAEITPTNVVAGTNGQSFTVYLKLSMSAGNTGVNRIQIALPSGFGSPRVTLVRQVLTTLSFTDSSVAGAAIAQLASAITSSTNLEVRFTTDVATQVAPNGVDFGAVLEDTRTIEPGVPASPGDANILMFSNRLRVTIAPGPIANVNLTPLSAELTEVETFRFYASPSDQHGNAGSSTVTWSAVGGVGFVDATGLFTATTPGAGHVIARVGTVADTAEVLVEPVEVFSELGAVTIPLVGGVVHPGDDAAAVLRFRIINRRASPDTLRRIDLLDAAMGPGNASQLDASWTALELWKIAPGSDAGTLARTAAFFGGALAFDSLAIAIPATDSVEFIVRGGASLSARDGDGLRVALGNAGALEFSSGGTASAAWPFVTNPPILVDGMSAAQIVLSSLANGIGVGARRHPVASILVPANGYAADTLTRVNFLQLGDADPMTDLPLLELWADDSSGAFEEGSDIALGALIWTGDRWERTGLVRPVPTTGLRLFVTADASETAVEGAVLRLALPSVPDVAFGMSSGNSGPIDEQISAPVPVVISVADRITLAAIGLDAAVVAPGQRDVPLLALELHNTFADARSLTILRVQNAVLGAGTLAQRDGELTRLELRDDANSNGVLDGPTTDPVLATAFLSDGRASFQGFDRPILAGQTRRLFVTGGVSLTDAADGDHLAVKVASAIDVGFEPASGMAAGWPLQSSSPPIIDGMVADQIRLPGARGVTLGPSDGPVSAIEIVVPRNGYLDDELTGVRVENAGSAASADVAELRLWLDGGDGAFDGGGSDDRDLGPLARIGQEWRSPILSEPLSVLGARLFVSAIVAASPADSATLRLRVPVDGISTMSTNRGPRDRAVENPEDIVFSTAPLLGSFNIPMAASTVGQSVQLSMRVRNVGAESVVAVTPVLTTTEGTGSLTILGPPVPAAADLAPGAETTFVWTTRADASGDARLTCYVQGTGAVSGLPRRSLFTRSNLHRIFTGAADLTMFSVQSMPFAVNRGQSGVVPISLTFEHPGSTDAADIRVDGITLRLEDQSSAPVIPSSLLAHVSVVEGATAYLERSTLETSGGAMLLDLARPIIVSPGEPVTVAFHFDISDSTNVTDFRVTIPDSSGIAASDATSGAPVVARLTGSSYPIRSGLARVLSGARELWAAAAPETARVTRGQAQVRMGVLRLRNAADPASGTDLRVGALRFELADSQGTMRRDVHTALARVSARTSFGTHADRAIVAADSTEVVLTLTNVLTVPAGASLDLELLADLREAAPLGHFSSVIRDSAWIDSRDASSGDPIPVLLASDPLGLGTLVVEAPADTLLAAGAPRFPASAGVGRPGLAAMTLVMRHPGASGTSRIRLDSLEFDLLDASRTRVAPGTYFDRVSLWRRGAAIVTQFAPPATAVPLTMPLPGLLLSPGGADTLTVMVDIDAAAPSGSIELLIRDSGWHVVESNTGLRLAVAAQPGEVMPFSSGVLRLDTPARRLAVGFESTMPAVLASDGSEAPLGSIRFENSAVAGSGSIDIASLRFVAESEAGGMLPIGAIAERLTAFVDGSPWASSGSLSPDSSSATLLAATALSVASATSEVVELRVTPRAGAISARFRLGLDRDDVGIIQPTSSLLAIAVEAAEGSNFPFWSRFSGLAETSVAGSYANFPNPFAAGREPTSFVFSLQQPARVSLRIWTLRGELVRTLLLDVASGPGLQQTSQWDGRNGVGRLVMNGVYVAELIVESPGAPSERVLRKVAVLR